MRDILPVLKVPRQFQLVFPIKRSYREVKALGIL
jgi:hypothetical protein